MSKVPTADYSLSSTSVAAILGVSRGTVQRWSDDGRLPSLRTPGGFRRFRQVDVEAFAATLLRSQVAS